LTDAIGSDYNSVMANNIVIGLHAGGATVALALGAYNLVRRPKGDRRHRWVGRVWVVAMYWTVLSSFVIKELKPGHFSWIHGLSLFTFGTLSIGLWGAFTHRIQVHRNFMTGSYFGLVGALIGAVVVPQRRIPQWFLHDPVGLAAGALISLAVAGAIIKYGPGARDGADREAGSGRPAVRPARR
jgi:uncharacterized membrane protein